MGENTDKVGGRVKQAAGDLTDNKDLKREGEHDETKGKVKGTLNDAVDSVKDAADDVRDKASRS